MSRLQTICEKHNLDLVILYGSQAKGIARPDSDYDLGILKRVGLIKADEFLQLAHDLGQALEMHNADLVDLRTAPPLLKYEAVRSARVLYESRPGRFNLFHVLAWKLYQDDRYDLRRLDRVYVKESLRRLAHDTS